MPECNCLICGDEGHLTIEHNALILSIVIAILLTLGTLLIHLRVNGLVLGFFIYLYTAYLIVSSRIKSVKKNGKR